MCSVLHWGEFTLKVFSHPINLSCCSLCWVCLGTCEHNNYCLMGNKTSRVRSPWRDRPGTGAVFTSENDEYAWHLFTCAEDWCKHSPVMMFHLANIPIIMLYKHKTRGKMQQCRSETCVEWQWPGVELTNIAKTLSSEADTAWMWYHHPNT